MVGDTKGEYQSWTCQCQVFNPNAMNKFESFGKPIFCHEQHLPFIKCLLVHVVHFRNRFIVLISSAIDLNVVFVSLWPKAGDWWFAFVQRAAFLIFNLFVFNLGCFLSKGSVNSLLYMKKGFMFLGAWCSTFISDMK